MSRSRADRLFVAALWLSGISVFAILAGIVVFTLAEAWPSVVGIGLAPVVAGASWHPTSGLYGMGPMIASSIAVSLLAMAIATPAGLSVAIVEQFYLPPPWSRMVRRAMEILSGIPSVVFGLWGLVAVVPLLASIKPPGTSLLAAAVVLAMMLVPTVALLSAIAFERVAPELRQAAHAMGLGRRTLVTRIALPVAAGGVASAVVLALARAIGETMMVLMVGGNVVAWPTALTEPVRTLTANMALEMAYAEGLHRSALFLSGVAVMLVALLLVAVTALIQRRSDDA